MKKVKKEWSILAKRMNKASFDSLRQLMENFNAYEPKTGPLQSASRDCVIDEEEVYTRIWTPG